jgi:hypothetical protein
LLRILNSNLVYKNLPLGVCEELKARNPPVYKGGTQRHRHHQFLTAEIGDPKLDRQIVAVTTLMRASRTWVEFKRLFVRSFPADPCQQGEVAFPDLEDESGG